MPGKVQLNPPIVRSLEKLEMAVATAKRYRKVADRTELEAVYEAREAGATWQQIAEKFSMTDRSAAFQKFSRRVNDMRRSNAAQAERT